MEYINRKTHPNRIERQKMKIIVTGTRGIPGIQGGVETHCEELFPRIADEKHEVIVIRRPEYKSVEYGVSKYKGVTILKLFLENILKLLLIHLSLSYMPVKSMQILFIYMQ